MDSSRVHISGYRTGFIMVLVLLVGSSSFTLWSKRRVDQTVDELVEESLQRAEAIATIRVDALQLRNAVADHIQAEDDEARVTADDTMDAILKDLKKAQERYTRDVPPGEIELWRKFNDSSEALVRHVTTARKYSKAADAERARKHLEEEVHPLLWKLDADALSLTSKHREETGAILHAQQELRLQTLGVASFISVLAVLAAVLVAFRVTNVIRRQEQTITAQMAELDRRNQELDSFASRVAHDLVAPLSPLKGYLTLVRRSPSVTDEQVKQMLTLAESSALRMSELVEALLRFCRAGKVGERAVGNLDTAVTTVLLEVAQTASAQNVELVRAVQTDVPVACPQQLLQSIAQNVISNAVKYTAGRPDARVVVRLTKEHGASVLEVSDNGPGMDEATRALLFTPFFRAAQARALPGHGLGLATTKRLVEAHGGTIQVVSTPEQGTQVTVRFSAATEAPPQVPQTAVA